MLRCVSILLATAALLLFAGACVEDYSEPDAAEVETTAEAVDTAEAAEGDQEYGCSYALNECLDWMAKHYSERGWAGLNLDIDGYTYTVLSVLPGSPADEAGILPGDLLVAVNGVEIAEQNEEKLLKIREKMKPGKQFTYTVKREGRRHNVDCKLVETPVEVAAEMVGRHLLVGHLPPHLAYDEDE